MGQAKTRGSLAERIATAKGRPVAPPVTAARPMAQFGHYVKYDDDGHVIDRGVTRDAPGSKYTSQDGRREYRMVGKSICRVR